MNRLVAAVIAAGLASLACGIGDAPRESPAPAEVAEPVLPTWEFQTAEDKLTEVPQLMASLKAYESISNRVGLPIRPVLGVSCIQGKTRLTIDALSTVDLDILDAVMLEGKPVSSLPVKLRIGDGQLVETKAAVLGTKQIVIVEEPVTLLWRFREADRMVAQWAPAMSEDVQVEWRWADLGEWFDLMDVACQWQFARFHDVMGLDEEARAAEWAQFLTDMGTGATAAKAAERVAMIADMLRQLDEAELREIGPDLGSKDPKRVARAQARLEELVDVDAIKAKVAQSQDDNE